MNSAQHIVRVDVETADSSVSDPQDGGYGWVCVGSCFAVNCFTWGVVAVRFSEDCVTCWGRLLIEMFAVLRNLPVALPFRECVPRGYAGRLCAHWRVQFHFRNASSSFRYHFDTEI